MLLTGAQVRNVALNKKAYSLAKIVRPYKPDKSSYFLTGFFLDWNWVQTRIRLLEFRYLFPGKLSMNEQIMNKFFGYMNNNQIAPMLNDMYACQNDPGSGWNKDNWICLDCLKSFISENILSWLIRQLVQGPCAKLVLVAKADGIVNRRTPLRGELLVGIHETTVVTALMNSSGMDIIVEHRFTDGSMRRNEMCVDLCSLSPDHILNTVTLSASM